MDIREDEPRCVVCKDKAAGLYEDQASCGAPGCEYDIQRALDYVLDHDGS